MPIVFTIINFVQDCIEVIRTDGDLTFEETRENPETVCGTFFSGDIHDVISIEVLDSNLNCDKREVLEVKIEPLLTLSFRVDHNLGLYLWFGCKLK